MLGNRLAQIDLGIVKRRHPHMIGRADQATPALGVAVAPAGSKWNFAWALHAGLAYQINPNVTLELAYSYVNLGSGTTGVISDFTGFQAGHVMKFNDITSNDLKLGVRWNFESEQPVYAPPPLVRKG